MMKSAIEWLLRKAPVLSNVNSESEVTEVKENSIINGQFSEGIRGAKRGTASGRTLERPDECREDFKSPWGVTLTPKSPRYSLGKGSRNNEVTNHNRSNIPHSKFKSSRSWENISFASDVTSPGFTSRIAKEGRSTKNYDWSRRCPVGQERFIERGVLPNVRLKGKGKPVIAVRRPPSSLLPLTSSQSPFSSSGFLASTSTRMPDISSVASVLDSPPSTSTSEDPTSLQAVVAALDKSQSLKTGTKRSRYPENDECNKKQRCTINSIREPSVSSALPSSGLNLAMSSSGEKRVLDLSPVSPNDVASGAAENSQMQETSYLSPENKRRCVPDPRIASFSSSKVTGDYRFHLKSVGRESPFSMYDSQRDSDSESNKSLDSQSKQSDHLGIPVNGNALISNGILASQDRFDRSGSQTPQSLRGSYCVSGFSNDSNSSSRTTTPSRPSHSFSLDAYKADKVKSQQRLNKMLGILFNVSDEEVQSSIQALKMNCTAAVTTLPSLPAPTSTHLPTPTSTHLPTPTSSHLPTPTSTHLLTPTSTHLPTPTSTHLPTPSITPSPMLTTPTSLAPINVSSPVPSSATLDPRLFSISDRTPLSPPPALTVNSSSSNAAPVSPPQLIPSETKCNNDSRGESATESLPSQTLNLVTTCDAPISKPFDFSFGIQNVPNTSLSFIPVSPVNGGTSTTTPLLSTASLSFTKSESRTSESTSSLLPQYHSTSASNYKDPLIVTSQQTPIFSFGLPSSASSSSVKNNFTIASQSSDVNATKSSLEEPIVNPFTSIANSSYVPSTSVNATTTAGAFKFTFSSMDDSNANKLNIGKTAGNGPSPIFTFGSSDLFAPTSTISLPQLPSTKVPPTTASPFTFNTNTSKSFAPIFGSGGGFTFATKVSTSASSTFPTSTANTLPTITTATTGFNFASMPDAPKPFFNPVSSGGGGVFTFNGKTSSPISSSPSFGPPSTFGSSLGVFTDSTPTKMLASTFGSPIRTMASTFASPITTFSATVPSNNFSLSSNNIFGSSGSSGNSPFGPSPSSFGGPPPSFTTTAPLSFGGPQPSFTTAAPLSFGSSTFGTSTASFGAPAPTFGVSPPTISFGSTSTSSQIFGNPSSTDYGLNSGATFPGQPNISGPPSSNIFTFGQTSTPRQDIFQFGSTASTSLPTFSPGTPGEGSASRRPKVRAFRRR